MSAGGGFDGKVVLVTGSSSGAGASIARAFGREGARVAVHCRAAKRDAETIAGRIVADGGSAIAFEADLADEDASATLADAVEQALGPVSVLINNAGPFADAPFRSLAPEVWDRIMAVNLKAPWLLAQRLAAGMERQGWGRIVNIGATSSLVRTHSVYGLAKAALLHLTESLALELAPAITVNAVVPSQIASPRTDTMPVYRDAAIAGTPLGRLVTEDEIGEMCLQVCSPAFDFVTGRTIVMDGGRTLPRFPRLDLPG
ncbi:MAG: SDR family oxidoreductase [Alphaproteobacteria bacterium]|nr:SDR family oxidoreductase [Alphaproteobacteria bacterium]